MKKLIVIGMVMASLAASAQTFTEKITKQLSFEKKGEQNALIIANINGSVKVVGYEGSEVQVELTRTIRGKTEARLEKGKAEIKLGIIDLADTLILYTQGLCNQFGRQTGRNRNGFKSNWGYDWNSRNDDECKSPADHTFNYVVKVPYAIHVSVSTVNQGDVTIENAGGVVNVNNVNGAITLTGISKEATAHTINGNVDITYAKNPTSPCRFYTLNGDINAWVQKGLSAELNFDSFNGDFYTNLARLESMPLVVEKKNSDKGVKYKIKGNRFRAGAGGPLLDFETFNGDVYLKEKTN